MKTIKVYGLEEFNEEWYMVKLVTDKEQAEEWRKCGKHRTYSVFQLEIPVQVQSDY